LSRVCSGGRQRDRSAPDRIRLFAVVEREFVPEIDKIAYLRTLSMCRHAARRECGFGRWRCGFPSAGCDFNSERPDRFLVVLPALGGRLLFGDLGGARLFITAPGPRNLGQGRDAGLRSGRCYASSHLLGLAAPLGPARPRVGRSGRSRLDIRVRVALHLARPATRVRAPATQRRESRPRASFRLGLLGPLTEAA